MTKMLSEILEQPQVLAGIEAANKTVLLALVDELNQKKVTHAVFAARGTSDHASIYGQYMLGIYKGIVSSLAQPSAISLYNAQFSFENDVVFGVSQSGKAADALNVIRQCNAKGGISVAVTNDVDSPMAKEAKYHLFCNAGVELSVAATKTFTAQMYLMALLTAYWSDNQALLQGLRELPKFTSQLLETLPAQLEKQVARFAYVHEGFVLARGLSYAVALESALKVQETCYVRMKGFAISDFYHGPLAQVDGQLPIIIYALKGESYKDAIDMIEKVTNLGTQVLVVSDDEALCKHHANSVLLPYTQNNATAPFLCAIFAQYFAQCLSISKGLNPDSPRSLNKVTITL